MTIARGIENKKYPQRSCEILTQTHNKKGVGKTSVEIHDQAFFISETLWSEHLEDALSR